VGEIGEKAEWSEAEKWAWSRIAEDEVADFSTAYGQLEPREAQGWSALRTLGSAFLRTILLDEDWARRLPVGGVRIAGVRWTGPLVLSHGMVNRPLILDRCRFEGAVDLTGCRFDRRISFQRSAFCGEGGPGLVFDQMCAARGDLCGSYFANGARGEDSVFTAMLDFTGAEFGGELLLRNARLGSLLLEHAATRDLNFLDLEVDRDVNLRGARVAGTLELRCSIVGQDLELGASAERPATFDGEIKLVNAVIKGSLSFVGATVNGAAEMNGIEVQRNLFMRSPLDIDEEKGTTFFKKELDLTGARITGFIEMSAAWFGGPVSLNSARVGGTFHATQAYFADHLDFMSLRLDGSINFNGAIIRKSLDLSDAHVRRHLNLVWTHRRLLCRRLVLTNAAIDGNFIFVGVCVGPVQLIGMRVGDSIFMRKSREQGQSPPLFRGPVNLSFSSAGNLVDLDGAEFAGRLDLSYIKVQRDLRMGVTVEGPLTLASGDIGGTLDLSTVTGAGVDMSDLHVGQDLFLRGIYRSGVKLWQARIDRMLDVEAELATLDLSGAVIGGEARIPLPRPSVGEDDPKVRLDLRDAKAGSLQIRNQLPNSPRPYGWPEVGSVHLDGFTVDRLGGYGVIDEEEMAWKPAYWFRRWLALDHPYSPQPYEHLTAVLRQAGQTEKANSILWYGRERARAASTGLRWLGLTLLKGSIGYGIGYRYFYALGWALLFTLIGVVVLFESGNASHSALLRPLWQKLFFSFDQLLPIIELNDEFSKVALKGWSQAYFYFHKLIGFLLGTFIAAGVAGLTQKSRS
jgi:uncharacterized protein YjbI with pentapeptide repeats